MSQIVGSRSRPPLIARFFLPEHMVRQDVKLGDDFGARSCYGVFIKMAWPAVLESVLMGLMNFVDTLMVSGVGEDAIAAVGLTANPRLIFFAFFFSLSVATNAIVSRRRGEGDREGANRCFSTILPVSLVISIVFYFISYLVSVPLLEFAGANEDTLEYATQYFRTTMFGMIFLSISLMANAAQRASGNTRIAMITSVCANVVNVALNAVLINGLFGAPQLGVRGAAIATAVGNMVAAAVSLWSVLRPGRYMRLVLADLFRPSAMYLRLIAKVSSGAMVEQLFLRIGFFIFAKLVAELGTNEFATHQICMTIINLSFTLGDGLGVATSALVGQNLGAARPDRSTMFGKLGQRIGIMLGLVLVAIFGLFGTPIISWFTDEPDIIRTGSNIVYMIMLLMPAQISQVIFAGCLRGAGETRYMAVVSLVTIGILRPLLTYVLIYVAGWGVYGAWVAILLDQYIRFAAAGIYFYSMRWVKVKV